MLQIDEGAVAWVHKTARRNAWRVCAWIDLDDLVQDGYLHFYRVAQKYRDVKTAAHIMSLFKVTYTNHLHDLSKNRTRQLPELLVCDLINTDDSEAAFWEKALGVDHELGTCFTAIMRASAPVRQLLANIASDQGIRTLRARGRLFKNGTRETLNDKFCRIAKCDNSIDLVGALTEVLT